MTVAGGVMVGSLKISPDPLSLYLSNLDSTLHTGYTRGGPSLHIPVVK